LRRAFSLRCCYNARNFLDPASIRRRQPIRQLWKDSAMTLLKCGNEVTVLLDTAADGKLYFADDSRRLLEYIQAMAGRMQRQASLAERKIRASHEHWKQVRKQIKAEFFGQDKTRMK
jgi:hypothetical protein